LYSLNAVFAWFSFVFVVDNLENGDTWVRKVGTDLVVRLLIMFNALKN